MNVTTYPNITSVFDYNDTSTPGFDDYPRRPPGYTEWWELPYQTPDFRWFSILIFIVNMLIFIIGIVGNFLVFFSRPLCLGEHHIYVKNFCLLNIMTVALLPLLAVNEFLSEWPFGWFTCKLTGVLEYAAFAAIPFLHIIINSDFIHKLKYPEEHNKMTKPWVFCSVLLFLCIVPGSIVPMVAAGEKDYGRKTYHCWVDYSMHALLYAGYISSLTISYLLTLVIAGSVYGAGKNRFYRNTDTYSELESNTARKLKFNRNNLIGYYIITGVYFITVFCAFGNVPHYEVMEVQHEAFTVSRLYAVYFPLLYYGMKRSLMVVRDRSNAVDEDDTQV